MPTSTRWVAAPTRTASTRSSRSWTSSGGSTRSSSSMRPKSGTYATCTLRRVDKGARAEHASAMTDLRAREPLTLPEIAAMKGAGAKIVMVTAYDHPSARLASEAGVDLILVGDSAGNNVLGYPSTVPVTMD